MKSIVLFIATLFTSFGAQAADVQIYRWVDANGRVTYSNFPPPPDAKNERSIKLKDAPVEADVSGGVGARAIGPGAAGIGPPVVLFIADCGEICTQARALLKQRGINFTERNPQTDGEAAQTLLNLVGKLEVPTVTIGSAAIKGYSEQMWNLALDSAGYPPLNAASRGVATPSALPPAGTPTK